MHAQNAARKNEMSKDQARLKRQVEHWKEQAGIDPAQVLICFVFGEKVWWMQIVTPLTCKF